MGMLNRVVPFIFHVPLGQEVIAMRHAIRRFALLAALVGLGASVGCGGPGAPMTGASSPTAEAEDAALAPESETAGAAATEESAAEPAAESAAESPAAEEAPADDAAPEN
jgi:hypothetical protein